MKTSNFDYNLPEELIAQKPATPRDHSRLMILNKQKKTIAHSQFFNLPNYLQKGDVLVFNNSKVIKARLFGNLSPELENKNIEIFLLKKIEQKKNECWQVLAKPGRKLKEGKKVYFSKNFFCESLGHYDEQTFLVKFNLTGGGFWSAIEKIGHIPIPPYIKNEPKKAEQYQTVYAKKNGSVAAPTAGLHFTKKLINKLEKIGVQIEYVTLHVGLGTFAPVKIDDLSKHKMHSEFAFIDKETADRLNEAKKEKRRIIAVGTTSCRVLESATKRKTIFPYSDQTNIFIYPPYKFKFVDALITNFHLPKSTLLMMVSALVQNPKDKSLMTGRNFILKAYKEAVKQEYHFFSFGDAMFIQ